MNRFASLLDRLAYEPRRSAKIRLVQDFLATTPDPERGHALAALTGALTFAHAKPAIIRALIAERTDPQLFALSYDYVGDLSETVALLWPTPADRRTNAVPGLADVVETLATLPRREVPRQLADWLDRLDETGRWALLKLITGGLRIGVSARLAKTAVAALGRDIDPDDVELVWHGLAPPYTALFAWVEGRGPKPEATDPAPFRPVMLAHALEDADEVSITGATHRAEWKWDGIRVQAVAGLAPDGSRIARLYSRSGDDISAAFPDLLDGFDLDAAVDGELLVMRDGTVDTFNALQQRLNRKTPTPRLIADFPAAMICYDLLVEGTTDWRSAPFDLRRAALERVIATSRSGRLHLSRLVPFTTMDSLAQIRAEPERVGAEPGAVEGLMIKRADSAYLPGRPKGLWFKWKRDPMVADCVLMYAQRGHGKRASFYSDFTFGVWKGETLVPVGKAYFGFTDEELKDLDRFVRKNTVNRFGPVREVAHGPADGLVLEIAFEGLQRSTRHKSGLAMRFPRIARIRTDKPAAEADRIEVLEALLRA